MLAYRHAFHAGNPADVLKHVVLLQALRLLLAKPKPLSFVDTHAGAGSYALAERMSQRLGEYMEGVGRLWQRDDVRLALQEQPAAAPVPAAVVDYLRAVLAFNPDGALRVAPGSPALAAHLLRESDPMHLFELHPADCRALQSLLGRRRHTTVHPSDGFAGLKAVLPPPSRRALVLIDPSYELDADYARLLAALRDAFERFATGVYVVWYPHVQSLESRGLGRRLRALAPGAWLEAQLWTAPARADGFGLMGSSMFVLNPPFGLDQALRESGPWLAEALGRDGAGRFMLDAHLP
ncbi:MAG: 23S rRNA (adenine(2030)-N(6))-methyltransferase RlmJ [Betaproteobacteria bacterium]|nr:23S rRNA (adenine(2030)-N(6))-methyltransferase RlmJ [Betaproteobacteria bacterium]